MNPWMVILRKYDKMTVFFISESSFSTVVLCKSSYQAKKSCESAIT